MDDDALMEEDYPSNMELSFDTVDSTTFFGVSPSPVPDSEIRWDPTGIEDESSTSTEHCIVSGQLTTTSDLQTEPTTDQSPRPQPHERGHVICAFSDTNGRYRPVYSRFSHGVPRIHWYSFKGCRLSPFDKMPNEITSYLKHESAKKASRVKPNSAEAVDAKFCEICRAPFADAIEHRRSESHQLRAHRYDWSKIDAMAAKLAEGRPHTFSATKSVTN